MTGRSLSAEERVHARRALLFLAERSAPARLAEALGLTVVALQKARAPSRVVGRRLAARVSSVAGVDLADVLSGAWPGDLACRAGRTTHGADGRMTEIHKYPRTRHLEGSRLQPGDADLDQVPLDALRGRYCVVEEKLDGANAGISLDADSRLRLQSRGHVLVGGAREKHWDLFKRWARAHATALGERATGGLTIFGEWLYAKHTIFYDQLPHYFLEFDIRDATGAFWSTERRLAHLAGSPIVSVPVLWHGVVTDPRRLPELVGQALYKSPRWRERLRQAATDANVDPDRTALETDPEPTAEGLYIKVEDRAQGIVVDRYKWLRASFLSAVLDSGSHWLARPIVANQLADGVNLFAVDP